jgi:hypothetical protein
MRRWGNEKRRKKVRDNSLIPQSFRFNNDKDKLHSL